MPLKDLDAKRRYNRTYNAGKYHGDPQYRAKHMALVAKRKKRNALAVKEEIRKFKDDGFLICGESEPVCLSAHHVKPKEKKYPVAMMASRGLSPVVVRRELSKCVCLCENCHRKVHAGIVAIPDRRVRVS